MNPTEQLKDGSGTMDPPTVRRLLDAGADIDVQNMFGQTLLAKAAWCNSLDLCTELLQWGANLHLHTCRGRTAWDQLDPRNDRYTSLYSLFLQYGVDVNQVDPAGWTALHGACLSNNHLATTRLLLTQGADPRLPVLSGYHKGNTAYDFGSFWETPEGRRIRFRWDTISIQEVFILASERGLVPIPSYLW